MERVRGLCERVAANKDLVMRFAVVEGEDRGPYANLMFESSDLQRLWGSLSDVLYGDEKVGPALSKASIAMCEGREGWNDYLLLYHFDSSVELDTFQGTYLVQNSQRRYRSWFRIIRESS